MLTKLYTKEDIVTPDCCYIKDWDINLSWTTEGSVAISHYNNTLYVNFNYRHDPDNRKYCEESDFLELRLWRNEKIICLWVYNKSNIANILSQIQDKLLGKEYISNEKEKISIDLYEYDLIFLSNKDDELNITKCKLSEFYILPNNEIVDNRYERTYHIESPEAKKRLMESRMFKKKTKMYYEESKKAIKDKFGDIAKYHLLIYGE